MKGESVMWEVNIGKYGLYFVFYNFILYSFCGWIYESSYVSFKTNKLVNRGFLNGPIIPIYGFGGAIIGLTLQHIREYYLLVFLMGILLATTLEYITSYCMELIFHAKWWDYSDRKFNIRGRICLEASLFWGLLSIVITSAFQPVVEYVIHEIPRELGETLGYIIIVLIGIDLIITVSSTVTLDQQITAIHKIRLEFKEYILSTKIFEITEDYYERYEDSQLSDIMDKIKQKLEDNYDKVTSRLNEQEIFDLKKRQEYIIENLKQYTNRFHKITRYRNYMHIRLLKAFPNLKVPNKEGALRELKEKLIRKRK